MNIEEFAKTKIGQFVIKIMTSLMESRFRYRFFEPMKIIQGADRGADEKVLEIGCGTGYFTIPMARFLGDYGSLTAIDILPKSIKTVTKKVQIANLRNVHVFKGDALNTQIDSESMDVIILFGVIPAPMLPMTKLLPGNAPYPEIWRKNICLASYRSTQIGSQIPVIYIFRQTKKCINIQTNLIFATY